MKILLLAWLFSTNAHALDPACTDTSNFAIAECPENSTDWYESYTDIVDSLEDVYNTHRATMSVLGNAFSVGTSTFSILDGTATLNGDLQMGADDQILLDDGSAGSPGLAFTNNPDTGIFESGTNFVVVSVNAAEVASFAAGTIRSQTAGSAGSPNFTWNTDTDTGLYNPDANHMAASANGVEVLNVSTFNITGAQQPGASTRQVSNQSLANGVTTKLFFGDNACGNGCYDRGSVWGGASSSGTYTTKGTGLYFVSCTQVISGHAATTLLTITVADDLSNTNIYAQRQHSMDSTNTTVASASQIVSLSDNQDLQCNIRVDNAGVTSNGSVTAKMTVQKIW